MSYQNQSDSKYHSLLTVGNYGEINMLKIYFSSFHILALALIAV